MTSRRLAPPPACRARRVRKRPGGEKRAACHGGHAAGGRGGAPERDGRRCAGQREKYGPRAFILIPHGSVPEACAR